MAPAYSSPPAPLKSPTPFHISIPEPQLQDFKTLLKLSKIPSPTFESLQDDGKFGVSHDWMTAAKACWEDGFDWRKCEENINSSPNFKSQVQVSNDKFEIHFAALFSKKKDAIPLLLLHGWLGSFLEFLLMMSLLKERYTPETLPYHVIATSMSGYGFSARAPLNRELGIHEVPTILNQLMLDLGFGSGYVAQGGDIGSRIGRFFAVNHDACKAQQPYGGASAKLCLTAFVLLTRTSVHLNWVLIPEPEAHPISPLTETEKLGIERAKDFYARGTAYSMENATKLSTLGFVLGSNPLAILAWIGEKFLAWSDVTPELDVILESVMLYWLTEGGGRGLYPYRRTLNSGVPSTSVSKDPAYYIHKPLGYSYFPKEIAPTPASWGGHYAAPEQSELLLGDIEDFVKQVWK